MLQTVLITLCMCQAFGQEMKTGELGFQVELDMAGTTDGLAAEIGQDSIQREEIQNQTMNQFYEHATVKSLKSPIVHEDTTLYNIYTDKPFTQTIYNIYLTAF